MEPAALWAACTAVGGLAGVGLGLGIRRAYGSCTNVEVGMLVAIGAGMGLLLARTLLLRL